MKSPYKIIIDEDFFEHLFTLELSLQKEFTYTSLSQLIELYQKVIEYYETENNFEACNGFQQRMNNVLSQPFIQKQMQKQIASKEITQAKRKSDAYEKMKARMNFECLSKLISYENNKSNNDINSEVTLTHSRISSLMKSDFDEQMNQFKERLKQRKKYDSSSKENESTSMISSNDTNNNHMHYIIDNFIKSINDLFYQKLFTKVIDALRLIYEDKFDKYKKISEYYDKDVNEENEEKANELLSAMEEEKTNEINTLNKSTEEKIDKMITEMKSKVSNDTEILIEIDKFRLELINKINEIINN